MRAMPLDLKVERSGNDVALLIFTGAMSLGSSLSLADAQVRQLIDSGVRKLAVNLTAVTNADSSGLGFLMHTNGLVLAKGGTMRIAGVSDRVRDLLTMTRVDRLLQMDANAEESLKILTQG